MKMIRVEDEGEDFFQRLLFILNFEFVVISKNDKM